LSNEAKRLEDEAKVAMADAQRQAEFNLQLMKRFVYGLIMEKIEREGTLHHFCRSFETRGDQTELRPE